MRGKIHTLHHIRTILSMKRDSRELFGQPRSR